MKSIVTVLVLSLLSPQVFAAKNKMSFSYKDTDVLKVIEDYSSASGQKFVVDAGVKGKVTVLNPEAISLEEAFNQLSMSLATNHLAISKQGDVMMVSEARSVQRNLIDVTTELPPLKPEKMHTWIINLKHISADEVNRQLRILTSRDGELVPFMPRNQLIITDWVSNLHRIGAMMAQIDRPGRGAGPVGTKAAKAANLRPAGTMQPSASPVVNEDN
jgi:general secretion pathway protein D